MKNNKEYIICSAIWYNDGKEYPTQPKNISEGIVISGHRHYNCIGILKSMFYDNYQQCNDCNLKRIDVLNNDTQGFLTSTNRFVDRIEGLEIAKKNNQLIHKEPLNENIGLFSEDLY